MAHSLTGRGQAPSSGGDGVGAHNLYTFHHFAALADKRIVSVASGSTACHFFALSAEGAVYAWGRNERGQLGLGDTRNRYQPALVPGLPPVAALAAGKAHSLALTACGQLWAAGDNSSGQCGVGRGGEVGGGMLQRFTRCAGIPGAAALAPTLGAGEKFSVVCAGGAIYTAGSHQHGQCGGGSTGERIITGNKLEHGESLAFEALTDPSLAGVTFTAVAAGACHGLALSKEGLPYSWGMGAYGRLGHGTPADVLTPAPIKYFEPERLVSGGGWGGEGRRSSKQASRGLAGAHCCPTHSHSPTPGWRYSCRFSRTPSSLTVCVSHLPVQ